MATEQNSTHTPGPWRAVNTPNGDFQIVYNETGNWLAEVFDDDDPAGRTEADARLIAAAPEMLELLVRISDSFPGYIPDFIEPVAKLRKKIEGRS